MNVTFGRRLLGAALGVLGAALGGVILLVSATAWAGPGHDHGHGHGTQPAAETPSSPRLTAVSETFELVGILKGEALTIYLDRRRDTSPVKNAILDVSIGSQGGRAKPQPDGTYLLRHKALGEHGDKEIIIVVSAGKTQDLLVGVLADNHDEHDEKMLNGSKKSIASVLSNTLLIVLLSSAIGLFVGFFMRFKMIGAAALVILTAHLAPAPVLAGPGHDHGHDHGGAAAATNGDAPRRLPDGLLFLPKPTQRLLEIRTKILQPQTIQQTRSLIGRVIADPNRSGLVQSTIGGRIKAPKSGLPVLGMSVKAGQILALVEPAFAPIDASDVRQKAGELAQEIAVLSARVKRQKKLAKRNIVSRASLQYLELELRGLRNRRSQLDRSQATPEMLYAPVNGVVAAVNVSAGQVVTNAKTLFQIVDPSSFWVEAIAFDAQLGNRARKARAQGPSGEPLELKFIGRSRALQNQASVLQFQIKKPPKTLDIGSPLRVLIESGEKITGLIVPREAIAQAPNGQWVAFKREQPERYRPVPLRIDELDGVRVLVTGGLKAFDQIIVRNAPLVNQVR